MKATTDDYERRLSTLEMDLKEEAHTQAEHYQRERSNLIKRHESAVERLQVRCNEDKDRALVRDFNPTLDD